MKMEESKIEGLEVIRKGVPFIMVLWEAVPSTAKEEEVLATIAVSPLFMES